MDNYKPGNENPTNDILLEETEPQSELTHEELLAENAKLKDTNRKLYARTKEAEKAEKELKTREAPAPSRDDLDTVLDLQSKGFQPEEIRTLRKYSTDMNKPISEIISDPIISAGIDSQRKKKTEQEATPAPSAPEALNINGKTWDKMTTAERKENFDAMMNGGVK